MPTIQKELQGKIDLVGAGGGNIYNFVLPTVIGTALPNALDNQVIEEVYLICDSTAGSIVINLPSIANFNKAWNCKIYVCWVAGGNQVTLNPYSTEPNEDTLNGFVALTFPNLYDTYYLHIVADNMWMALKCSGPVVPPPIP
jgi:hypothetical protein